MRTLKYRILPSFHALDIELTFLPTRLGPLRLHLPIWRPGRYQVQHFARNIAVVTSEQALVVKSDLSTWMLEVVDLRAITVKYRYHAEQPDAGGSWVDESMIYINFINCMLFPHRGENRPCEVDVVLPAGGYETSCSLRTYENKIRAKTYRELVDSPFLAAPSIHSHTWKSNGATFYLQGLGPKIHFSDRLVKAYQKFVEYQLAYMGEFPVRDYRFMLWICSKPFYHGVEHTKSTMMVLGPEDRDEASKQTLVESSIDLWLDGYGAALPGKRVSIYFKGALIALGLDLFIRKKFNHTKSLRDVMLLMQLRYGD
jgi:predicted metalloprotease with PDZ domain